MFKLEIEPQDHSTIQTGLEFETLDDVQKYLQELDAKFEEWSHKILDWHWRMERGPGAVKPELPPELEHYEGSDYIAVDTVTGERWFECGGEWEPA